MKSYSNYFYYLIAFIIIMFACSYIAVPLYQLFCEQTGYGGFINKSSISSKVQSPTLVHHHNIKIQFLGQSDPNLPILFKENQSYISTFPGITNLAFYTATNLTNDTLYGVSTYNITPAKAAPYFHKIQCFCFDEQRWTPHETLEMPILFYIDPALLTDPATQDIDFISINYTFFPSIHYKM